MYLIDVGSSTIKVYRRERGAVTLVRSSTFSFKDDFDPHVGLSADNSVRLYEFFSKLSAEFDLNRSNTKIYATGIFREIIEPRELVEEFYVRTKLLFNIVSHELEEFYLETAWTGQVDSDQPLMVVNIGGRTTEIVFYSSGDVINRELLSVGVGLILKEFADINSTYSAYSMDDVMASVTRQLPPATKKFGLAICTGGELTFMQITGYGLVANTLFSDPMHPSQISLQMYDERNRQVFDDVSIDELRALMPENPGWMNGARAYSAIAQAICAHYGVDTIVPSDSNLIDGVNVREARKVVLCGSFNRHLPQIAALATELREHGMVVLSPRDTRVVGAHDGFVLFEGDRLINNCTWSVESVHLRAMDESDLVLICNFDDYVGTKTALEIGYAHRSGKKIVFLQDGATVSDFDLPSEVGLLLTK